MTSDIIGFILGLLVGSGAMLAYLHKHQAAAIAAATKIANDVADAKIAAAKVSAKV